MRDFIEVLVKLNNFATRQLVITLIISVRTMLLVVNYMYFCFASVIWGGLGPPDHLPRWFLKP